MDSLYTASHNTAVVAVLCTLLGGVARDLVMSLIGRPKSTREEYRTEIAALRTEVHALSDQVTVWRNEYYTLLDAVVRGDRAAITALLHERN